MSGGSRCIREDHHPMDFHSRDDSSLRDLYHEAVSTGFPLWQKLSTKRPHTETKSNEFPFRLENSILAKDAVIARFDLSSSDVQVVKHALEKIEAIQELIPKAGTVSSLHPVEHVLHDFTLDDPLQTNVQSACNVKVE